MQTAWIQIWCWVTRRLIKIQSIGHSAKIVDRVESKTEVEIVLRMRRMCQSWKCNWIFVSDWNINRLLKMVAISALNIFTIFLIARDVTASLIKDRGTINLVLGNKACVASDVIFTSGAHSKLECFVQCAQNEACRGIFYGGVGQCMGCSLMSTNYDPNSLPGQTGTAFYGRSCKYPHL